MENLEVGHLGGISRISQGLESLPDQCRESSAEDRLLSEEVGVRLVVEGGLEDSSAGGSESLRECKGDLLGVAGDILVDAYEGGDSESLGEDEPLHVSGGLGRHHDDVDIRRGLNQLVGDGEAVCELECGALLQVGLDVLLVDVGLDLVRQEHHDDICVLDGVSELRDLEAVLLGLVPGLSVLPDSDRHIDPGVVEAQSLGPSLGPVSQDGDFLAVEDFQVRIFIVIKLHGFHTCGCVL